MCVLKLSLHDESAHHHIRNDWVSSAIKMPVPALTGPELFAILVVSIPRSILVTRQSIAT
jgi:hypothetical protein